MRFYYSMELFHAGRPVQGTVFVRLYTASLVSKSIKNDWASLSRSFYLACFYMGR